MERSIKKWICNVDKPTSMIAYMLGKEGAVIIDAPKKEYGWQDLSDMKRRGIIGIYSVVGPMPIKKHITNSDMKDNFEYTIVDEYVRDRMPFLVTNPTGPCVLDVAPDKYHCGFKAGFYSIDSLPDVDDEPVEESKPVIYKWILIKTLRIFKAVLII